MSGYEDEYRSIIAQTHRSAVEIVATDHGTHDDGVGARYRVCRCQTFLVDLKPIYNQRHYRLDTATSLSGRDGGHRTR